MFVILKNVSTNQYFERIFSLRFLFYSYIIISGQRNKLKRNNEDIEVKIKPVKTGTDEYKLGIWVRDDTQGIGTLTYITTDGKFGALGHGISDIDTGELLSSSEGILYEAQIWGIKKGEAGSPGGLCGIINYEEDNILGNINKKYK